MCFCGRYTNGYNSEHPTKISENFESELKIKHLLFLKENTAKHWLRWLSVIQELSMIFLKKVNTRENQILLPFAGCLKISKLRNISWNRRWKATGYMYQELYQPIIACVYLLRSKTTLIRPTGMYGDVGTGFNHLFW